MKNKRGFSMLYQIIIHLILIVLIFGLFYVSASSKVNSNNVRQQLLEKQLALMMDSSPAGTTLSVNKLSMQGKIDKIEIKNGRIFVMVNGQSASSKGYPMLANHNICLDSSDPEKFKIAIKDEKC